MELPLAKRPRPNQRLCPHCSEIVSYKTYKNHKRLFHNNETDSWFGQHFQSDTPGTSEGEDVHFSESPPSFFSNDYGHEESPPCSEPALSESDTNEWQSEDDCNETWSNCSDLSEGDDSPDQNGQGSPPTLQTNEILPSSLDVSSFALIRWLMVFFLLLQAQFHLSDRVISVIFLFLKQFFVVLGRIYPPCAVLGTNLPRTLYYTVQKTCTNIHNNVFQRFPVCKRCGTVWKFSDCIEGHGIHRKAKLCMHVPSLTGGRHRTRCNGMLLKTVELATNRRIFYPLMTYCYIDLKTSLQHLLSDNSFVTKSEHWKSRSITDSSLLGDVYDGRVWKHFLNYNGKPFLSDEFTYACMLNIDWFQPYKHLTYSIGAIYLSFFNLPRPLRYKLQNVCLIGILPGPREPELTINSYLNPLIQDLLQLWDGVSLSVCSGSHLENKLVRCAVICCSCDLPAGRKLCGFLGHSAHLGCSKCKKYFKSGSNGLDYSGFDRENWISRTNHSHRQDVDRLSHCTSKSQLRQKESEFGCRYSSLLDLPYFDPPTMLVIDPMHNLFLGLAKHFFKKILIGKGILSEAKLSILQKRIDKMRVPSDIGRIPQKIESSFYGFTADQYKNWAVHYSIISLHGLLSSEQLECWRHFVLASRILCKTSLKLDEVTIADALLLQFCRRCEILFGKEIITPNMHMSCHLRECILDYGPTNHFWLFAFERFNGILGQLPNNNRSIEVQMMKRFLSDTEIMRISPPDEFQEDFQQLISFQRNPVGTLGSDTLFQVNPCEDPHTAQLPHNYRKCAFDTFEMEILGELFANVYTLTNCAVNITYSRYAGITIEGKAFGSYKSRSKNSSIVIAEYGGEFRPARINYFAKVYVSVDGVPHTHILACLSWFKHHIQKNICGKPVTVWEHDLFDSTCFTFTESIKCRTVSLVDKLDDVHGNVLFISPYE